MWCRVTFDPEGERRLLPLVVVPQSLSGGWLLRKPGAWWGPACMVEVKSGAQQPRKSSMQPDGEKEMNDSEKRWCVNNQSSEKADDDLSLCEQHFIDDERMDLS